MLLLALVVTGAVAGTARQVDICIYGGTSSGVMAAYTACKAGKTVLLVEPTDRIGGLTTGGLGMTDVGNPYIMKGYTRGFYESIGKYYGTADMHFTFEPKVALMLFQRYVDEAGIDILYNHRLHKVKKKGNRIAGIVVENSTKPRRKTDVRIEARVFLDCSYEGDLMAKAGVSYTTGREDNSQYGETWNGAHISKYKTGRPQERAGLRHSAGKSQTDGRGQQGHPVIQLPYHADQRSGQHDSHNHARKL